MFVVKKKDGSNLYIKNWHGRTWCHFYDVYSGRKEGYTSDLNKAKIYRSVTGAEKSLGKLIKNANLEIVPLLQ